MNSIQPLALAQFSGAEVTLENLLASRQPDLSIMQGDDAQPVILTTDAASPSDQIVFHCASGANALGIGCDRAWLQAFYPNGVADLALDELPEVLGLATAEIVLQPVLTALGSLFSHPISVQRITAETPSEWRAIHLSPATGATPAFATLLLSEPAEQDLLGRIEALPINAALSLDAVAVLDLHVGLGSQFVDQDELENLRPGAVVLMPRGTSLEHPPIFVGPNFSSIGFANIDDTVLTLRTASDDTQGDDMAGDGEDDVENDGEDAVTDEAQEDALAEAPTEDGADAPSPAADEPEQPLPNSEDAVDVDVEDLEVRLDFVLGQKSITLAELRELTAGTAITLDTPTSHAVEIYASGRRVGQGEMVEIDGNLGVRITRVNRRSDG